MIKISKCLMAFALLTISVGANAQSITYAFSGTVTSATGIYSSISVGTPLNGTYTINLANGIPEQSFGTVGSTTAGWDVVAEGGTEVEPFPAPAALPFTSTITGPGVSYVSPSIGTI